MEVVKCWRENDLDIIQVGTAAAVAARRSVAPRLAG